MAKAYIKDTKINHVLEDVKIASASISQILTVVAHTEPNLEELPVQSNVPALAADGTANYTLDLTPDGAIDFKIENPRAFSQPYVVTIWDEVATIPQAAGEPLKRVKMLYIINLPTAEELRTDPQLMQWRTEVLERAALASARKIAKSTSNGVEGFGLMDDPVSQFLMAQTSAASRERAFNALFPVMQAALIRQGAKLAKRLFEAGNKGDAALVKSTWSRARLSKDTLRSVLSAHQMADFYFPTMTTPADKLGEDGKAGQAFDNFLRKFIAYAPNHKRKVTVKGPDGQPVKEVVDGKERNVTEMVPAPQDPAILVHWLNTRYEVGETLIDSEADITLDFDDLQMG